MLCDPLLIYIKGEDIKTKDPSYVCTFLQTLAFLRSTSDIDNDRILLYFPGNRPKCKKKKYKSEYEGMGIPGDIPVIELQELRLGMNKKCIRGVTPVIFIFDGHGYVSDKNVSIGYTKEKSVIGNMILDGLDMDEKVLSDLFRDLEENPKLLIFTQCGSKNLLTRCSLNNSIIISSTDQNDSCSYGVGILHKIEDLLMTMFENKNTDLDFFLETLRYNGLGIKKSPWTIDWPLSVFFTRLEKTRRFTNDTLNGILNHPIIRKHFGIDTILGSISTKTLHCLVRLLSES